MYAGPLFVYLTGWPVRENEVACRQMDWETAGILSSALFAPPAELVHADALSLSLNARDKAGMQAVAGGRGARRETESGIRSKSRGREGDT